ncbi:MAG: hypothetical protein R3B70_24555 [Polyangiaceae bacterium]
MPRTEFAPTGPAPAPPTDATEPGLDEKALFEALCRVQSATAANDGPAEALARLAREIGHPLQDKPSPRPRPTSTRAPNSPSAAERHSPADRRSPAERHSPPSAARAPNSPSPAADDFPDFAAEPPDPPLPAPPPWPPAAASPLPAGEDRDALVRALLQTLGDYQGLLTRYQRDFDETFARRARAEPESDDASLARLRAAQVLLVKYPLAAQAAFAALVREGQKFAETEEGRTWKQRLSGSPTVARARTLFEGLAGGVAGGEQGNLPSAYVDAFVRALDRDMESVLADLGGAAGADRGGAAGKAP